MSFLKDINPKNWFSSKKKDEKKFIEEEFKKGNIIIPTDLRDYEDLEEFKEKTSDIESIKESLQEIENSKQVC